MKLVIQSLAVVICAGTVLSQTGGGPLLRPSAKPEMVTRTIPGTAVGIVDARVSDAVAIAHIADQIQGMSQVMVKTQRKILAKDQTGLQLAEDILKDKAFGAVVVVVDDTLESPRLALYPEDRMAVINAKRICADVTVEKASERLSKELHRAVAMIAGGLDTGGYCVLKPILGNDDLDKLVSKTFSPQVAITMSQNASKFGFGKIEYVPYRLAVVQGWAPKPTNEVQRAIQEQVKKTMADKKPSPAAKAK